MADAQPTWSNNDCAALRESPASRIAKQRAVKEAALRHGFLLSCLAYNGDTGLFVWKLMPNGRVRPESVAGRIMATGYCQICIGKRLYLAHRLAWFYVHGEWPNGHIDHINGVRWDNRISNLRVATQSENQQNRKRVNGCTWKDNRWQAQIGIDGRTIYIGRFLKKSDAISAYFKAKARLHPTSYVKQGK